ncbi:hypothetical protein [Phyllobacterium leguminum]|uniref:UrcA family protein n=1 Tax=Phyllobacterium leguminum TaxID=314237 RepID=A0A318T1U3_9HYPH|nr:hypothetical protein [Phyllobacterium leguminum]PYE88370.1 hypothetical protein C7477_10712 [Phyllobacterium leguminum]
MRFLLKMAFWMTLAFVVLPQTPLAELQRDMATWAGVTFSDDLFSDDLAIEPAKTVEKAAKTLSTATEKFATAKEKLEDLSSFCARNAFLCETGKAAVSQGMESVLTETADPAHTGTVKR